MTRLHWKRHPMYWVAVFVVMFTFSKVFFEMLYDTNVSLRLSNDISSRDLTVNTSTKMETTENMEDMDFDVNGELHTGCTSSFGLEGKAHSDINVLDIYEGLDFENTLQYGDWHQNWKIQIDDSRFTDADRLTVFLVPHAHNDPGWLKTFETYYNDTVRDILDLMLERLDKNPSMKFIWAEMSFFSLWWDEISQEKRERLKQIVERQQLEFVTGGWVMPDEANSHYYSIIIQLFEGNQWLQQHLGYVPRNGWSIDPFGLSPTMAYILKRSGFQNMLIQRTHYLVKQFLGNRQELEFLWRQNWDKSGSTDMMTHMEPFSSYTTVGTCGPDQYLCRTFDFREPSSPWYTATEITEENVAKRSADLVDQYKKKGMLFKTNKVLVPIGADFGWNTNLEWDDMTRNYVNISNHVNQRKDLLTEMRFATLDEYFEAIESDIASKKINLSKLSGDFFTYADKDDHYWSGYYTSRPFHKALDRKLISDLRAAHLAYTFLNAELFRRAGGLSRFPFMSTLFGYLRIARRSLSLFQHHDGVTGTSKDDVMDDYAEKLNTAIDNCNYVMEQSLQILTHISHNGEVTAKIADAHNNSLRFKSHFSSILRNAPIYTLPSLETISLSLENPTAVVTLFNPIQKRTKLVSLRIRIPEGQETTTVQVTNLKRYVMESELFPIFEHGQISQHIFELNFVVKLDAMAVNTFLVNLRNLTGNELRPEIPQIFLEGNHSISIPPNSNFNISSGKNLPLEISNSNFRVNFDSNGFINSVDLHGKIHDLKIGLFTYGTTYENRVPSGLYLFMPDGPAKRLEVSNPLIKIVKGRLKSYVEVSLPIIQHRVTIYEHPGIDSGAIEISNLIDINNKSNFELLMRLESNVQSGNVSYTDLNAFQMIKRNRFESMPIQGNYYPMPSASYIEDSDLRVTVLGGQPVGTASLESGQIDVVMDRTLLSDDGLGVGQGSGPAVKNLNVFKILLETPTCLDEQMNLKAPMLSLRANLIKNELLHPIKIFEATAERLNEDLLNLVSDYNPTRYIPCDVEFVDAIPLAHFPDSLDDLKYTPLPQAAVILHRVGFDARFHSQAILHQCRLSNLKSFEELKLEDLLHNMLEANATQKSLSFLHDFMTLGADEYLLMEPMEIYTFHVRFK